MITKINNGEVCNNDGMCVCVIIVWHCCLQSPRMAPAVLLWDKAVTSQAMSLLHLVLTFTCGVVKEVDEVTGAFRRDA